MSSTGHVLRCLWPITDPGMGFTQLCAQAAAELPAIATQSHARITGPGHFTVTRSAFVPGSGNTTEHVLLFQAPAQRREPRPYHARSA